MRKSNSFFSDINSRELDGSRARNMPRLCDLYSDPGGPRAGVLNVDHQGLSALPLAVSFCMTRRCAHLLAVSDEDGYLSIFDTRRHLPSLADIQKKKGEAKVCDWLAHDNAIFDVSWINDDTQILTASGDQTIKLWNPEHKRRIGTLAGHRGSVKSIASHASNPFLLVSGSRDGSFALWDLRCSPSSRKSSIALVEGAHMTALSKSIEQSFPARPVTRRARKIRKSMAPPVSITSVLYLKDDISIATAGSSDSIVKFWDTRNLKSSVTQTCSHCEEHPEKGKFHGITSLSQDSSGTLLAASCMDDRIYLYNILCPTKTPVKTFCGSLIDSFYVKSAISPDGGHVLAGSSDGDAYIWQVSNSQGTPPIRLTGHNGEVTAVDWFSTESDMLATCSDDLMVRIWNRRCGSSISPRSPACLRKRVMAEPIVEKRRKLKLAPKPSSSSSSSSMLCSAAIDLLPNDDVLLLQQQLQQSSSVTEYDPFHTPESVKRRRPATEAASASAGWLEMQDEPKSMEVEAPYGSPSSVLNPPSSLKKKTILDYFAAHTT